MRVMVLVKATAASEAGVMPGTGLLAAMSRCNVALSCPKTRRTIANRSRP